MTRAWIFLILRHRLGCGRGIWQTSWRYRNRNCPSQPHDHKHNPRHSRYFLSPPHSPTKMAMPYMRPMTIYRYRVEVYLRNVIQQLRFSSKRRLELMRALTAKLRHKPLWQKKRCRKEKKGWSSCTAQNGWAPTVVTCGFQA